MIESLRIRLGPFLIDAVQLNEKKINHESTTVRALIFLPPQNHLLFLFQIAANQTVVHIRTDYWRVLNFVDEFLEGF